MCVCVCVGVCVGVCVKVYAGGDGLGFKFSDCLGRLRSKQNTSHLSKDRDTPHREIEKDRERQRYRERREDKAKEERKRREKRRRREETA